MNLIHSLFHFVIYLPLVLLAFGCAYTANRMSPDTCPCRKALLILMVIGVVYITLCTWYEMNADWVLASTIPLNLGVGLWLVLDPRGAEEELEQFVERIKLIF